MNHTKPSHRILAVLLSVMLCVSMLPVTALAEDADTGAENDAVIVDTAEPATEEAPAEEAEEALAEEASEEEVLEEATELDPGVPETETLAEDGTAYSGTCGENLTWSLADGTLTISGTGAMANYSSGGAPWYGYRNQISTIVIENGVTSIAASAFAGCSGLTSVVIPASVTNIGGRAFAYCTSLTEIAVSVENETYCSVDGVLLTKDKTTLVCCPGGKTGAYTIPANVMSIDQYALEGCNSLTSIVIPKGMTSIGDYAFYNCDAPMSISIPEGVTSIGNRAFYNCNYLKSVSIPESVTSIGYEAFTECEALSSIRIPVGVTSIGALAFSGCRSLSGISIPAGVTRIGEGLFSGCIALISVSIPASVTIIDWNAFESCGLTDVYYGGTEAQWTGMVIREYNDCLTTATIHYEADGPSGTCGENLTWRLFNGTLTISGTGAMENFGERNTPWYSKRTTISTVVIESGVTNITDWLLGNCTALTGISIPESVTSIGIRPFIGCTALTSLSIPESVTSIGEGAFANCSALTSINIPAGVTSITWGEFWNCTSLASISIPDGVTSIEDNAFNNCDALTSVRIPDSVTSIGEDAFYSCGGLTDISIPDSVTSIGQKAFGDCDALVHVSLPKGITSISRSAFFSCSALTGISIPESVTSIGIYAFDECNALEDVYYGGTEAQWGSINIARYNDCLTKATIHYEAGFGSCGENLAWTLEDGTLTISGSGAMNNYTAGKAPWYEYRSKISTVVLESGVTGVGDYAFDGCSALTNVYYGGSEAQWNSISIGDENDSLTKATITFAVCAAVIGTVRYQTLSAATDAAQPGDTITLQADISDERFVVVEAGVTLDLNGHKLTGAKLLYVTGSLVDHGSSKGAFSAGAYYMNNGEHTQFPVYNSAAGTYSLYEIGFYASATKAPKYRFGLDRAGDGTDAVAATALMKSDANQGRVVAMVTVSWTQGEGSSAVDVSKTFTFTPNYMSAYLVSPFTKSFAITLSGMDSVGTVKAQPKFVVLDNNNSVMYTYAGPVWNIG